MNSNGEKGVERKWEDLGMDCLVSVFQRLDVEDLILGVPLVCKSWYEASLNPTCWKSLDLFKPIFEEHRYEATFEEGYLIQTIQISCLLKLGLNRGGDRVFKLLLPSTCSLDTLIYASAKCPCLKVLGLPTNLYRWDDKEIKLLIGLISKWKDLQCVGLGGIEYPHTKELLSVISCHCRNFAALWKRGLDVPQEAEAIANFLPSLKYLSLSVFSVTRDSLNIVLEGCRVLEHLLIKNCGFDDSEEVLKKMTSHVKNAKFVHVRYYYEVEFGGDSDYEDEDYGDYNPSSREVDFGGDSDYEDEDEDEDYGDYNPSSREVDFVGDSDYEVLICGDSDYEDGDYNPSSREVDFVGDSDYGVVIGGDSDYEDDFGSWFVE